MAEAIIKPPLFLGDHQEVLDHIGQLAARSDKVPFTFDRHDPIDYFWLPDNNWAQFRAQVEVSAVQAKAVLRVGRAAVGLDRFAHRSGVVDLNPEYEHVDPWRLHYQYASFVDTTPLKGIYLSGPFPMEFVHGILAGYSDKDLFDLALGGDITPNTGHHRQDYRDGEENALLLNDAVNRQLESGNLDSVTVPAGEAVFIRGNNLHRRNFDGFSNQVATSTVTLSSADPVRSA